MEDHDHSDRLDSTLHECPEYSYKEICSRCIEFERCVCFRVDYYDDDDDGIRDFELNPDIIDMDGYDA